MFLLGLGSGLSFMPLFLIATSAIRVQARAGLVSGLISTSPQMIGGAIGLALLAGLAAARAHCERHGARGECVDAALVDFGSFHAAFLLGATALSLITAILYL